MGDLLMPRSKLVRMLALFAILGMIAAACSKPKKAASLKTTKTTLPDVSAPVTANHLSSEPDKMKMIGATHCFGRPTKVSMLEFQEVVAGKHQWRARH